MAKVKAEIKKRIIKYYEAIKHEFPIKKIFLFGSHARGNPREYSDIDVGVVIDLPARNEMKILKKLWRYARTIDCDIEPMCIFWSEFQDRAPASVLADIVRNGIDIVNA